MAMLARHTLSSPIPALLVSFACFGWSEPVAGATAREGVSMMAGTAHVTPCGDHVFRPRSWGIAAAEIRQDVCSVARIEWMCGEANVWRRSKSLESDGYTVYCYENLRLPGFSFVARSKGTKVHRLVATAVTNGSNSDAEKLVMMLAIACDLAWGKEIGSQHLDAVLALGDAVLGDPESSAQERAIGGLRLSAGAIRAYDGSALMFYFDGSAHP